MERLPGRGQRPPAAQRVAADVIVRDQDGRLLLVNPTYKPDWDLPGGMVEANEPPIEAAARELRQEPGLDVHIGARLAVDWIEPHAPWEDTLAFVSDGGTLSADQIDALHITDDELAAFRFCSPSEAADLLRPYVWQRATNALEALGTGRTQYFHRRVTPGVQPKARQAP